MKIRGDFDYIISGGLWWTDRITGKSHSLNLLYDNGKQIQAGVYSRFGLAINNDKSFDFKWFSWNKDLKDMLGGSPSLVVNGEINIDGEAVGGRHPRAGVGSNDTHFFMVTIDGRQRDKKGATNSEFAKIMKKLGCKNAIGVDGGGTVHLQGPSGTINSITENRAMNNAIGVKIKEE